MKRLHSSSFESGSGDHSFDENELLVARTPMPFLFAGRECPAASLDFHRMRYFDPTVGRWMSEDLVGFAGDDENLRRYMSE